MGKRAAAALCMAAACLLAAGCDLSQLAFRVDHRLHFLTPKSRQLVRAPFTVAWTMRDFTVVGLHDGPVDRHSGYFAVFVDRAPVKPGQSLQAVVNDDSGCRNNPSCVNPSMLANHQVYVTTRPQLRVPLIGALADHDKIQLHDLTVIILDTSGHRIGEYQWDLEFKMRRSEV